MNKGKYTEQKFKSFCSKKNIFASRLNDNIGNNQIADYIIILENKIKFFEIKEVKNEKNYYDFNRTTQESYLKLVEEISSCCESYIFIYFNNLQKIVCMPIKEYLNLKKYLNRKNFTIDDVDKRFTFGWDKSLENYIKDA